jgi:phospholipase C
VNPLPAFPSVQNDISQRIRLVDTVKYYRDAANGTLPDVSWICPDFENPLSEHPGFKGDVRSGMAYVTGLVNAAMQGPDWAQRRFSSRGMIGEGFTIMSCRPE